jgi:flagellar motility protein MotE (MotC chaperone)
MKKLLPIIGFYVGTFIVLNVGMFFLLKFTQPEPVAQHEEVAADSTFVAEETEHPALEEDAEFDHAPDEEQPIELTEEPLTVQDTAKQIEHIETAEVPTETVEQDTTPAEEVAAEPEVALNDTPKSTAEIAKLAKLLEGMKPAEAAVIAERLPTETIVDLVMRMKSRSGAKMMASLPVPVAASVATRMAELSGSKQ